MSISYVIVKSLHCGTSFGANIQEATDGQSKKDLFAKMTIAYKEARETHYWIIGYDYLLTPTISVMKDSKSLLHTLGEIMKTIGLFRKQ